MPAPRHVVYDIGRVLLHYDPEIPYRRLLPDDAARARFLSEVCSPAWNAEQDRGRGWSEAEDELVARFPDDEEPIRAFRRVWAEMVPHLLADSVVTFEALVDAGVDVTLLTNFAADTFAEVRERYPVLGRGRGVTVSAEVGLLKPDPEIYRLHARTFGLDPSATLFVDDAPANVAGAREVGWDAVLFTTAERLDADLRQRGLPVPGV